MDFVKKESFTKHILLYLAIQIIKSLLRNILLICELSQRGVEGVKLRLVNNKIIPTLSISITPTLTWRLWVSVFLAEI